LNQLALALALVAGGISITSPCCLPLLPGYLGYLSGMSTEKAGGHRWRPLAAALLFVAGFSIVFIALGATASELGSLLLSYRIQLYQVAGVAYPGGTTCVAAAAGCLRGFSFPNIHVPWTAPPDNFGARENEAFDVSGTACGMDPTTANWAIATSGAGLPPTTLHNVFTYTNPYPALDWRWAGSKNSQPAELQGRLRLSGSASPTMTFETAKLGAGAADIGGPTVTPQSAPVTAKRVAAC